VNQRNLENYIFPLVAGAFLAGAFTVVFAAGFAAGFFTVEALLAFGATFAPADAFGIAFAPADAFGAGALTAGFAVVFFTAGFFTVVALVMALAGAAFFAGSAFLAGADFFTTIALVTVFFFASILGLSAVTAFALAFGFDSAMVPPKMNKCKTVGHAEIFANSIKNIFNAMKTLIPCDFHFHQKLLLSKKHEFFSVSSVIIVYFWRYCYASLPEQAYLTGIFHNFPTPHPPQNIRRNQCDFVARMAT
jgi:hypothetical protein